MRFKLMTLSLLVVGFVLADSKPYKGKAHRIPGKIEAEHYDEGAPGKAYLDEEEKTLGPTTVKLLKWILKSVPMPPMAMASAGHVRGGGSITPWK